MFYKNSRLLSGRHPPPSPIHEELANRHAALRWWKVVASVFPGWKNHPPSKVEWLETWKWWFFDGFPEFGIWFRADLKRWNMWKKIQRCTVSIVLTVAPKRIESGCEGIYCIYATEKSDISFRFLIYLYSHFSTIKKMLLHQKNMCKSCQISPSPCLNAPHMFLPNIIYIGIYIYVIYKKSYLTFFFINRNISPKFCLKRFSTPRCRPDGQRHGHVCCT